MPSQKFFGQTLRQLRQSNQLTIENLGDLLQVSKQTISRWELGTREPNLDMLIQIANLFFVSADYLLGRTNEPQQDYYYKQAESALLVGAPPVLLLLFNYAKTAGRKNIAIPIDKRMYLIHMFSDWKLHILEKIKSCTPSLTRQAEPKNCIYESIPSVQNGLYVHDAPDFSVAGEEICLEKKKRLIVSQLPHILHLTPEDTQTFLADLPETCIEYLYPLVLDDMKLPESSLNNKNMPPK